MAHTKQQKASRINHDSKAKRLGVKIYGGAAAHPGNIIVRQRGNTFWPGKGVLVANDFTLMSLISGVVKFTKKNGKHIISVE